MTDEQIPGQLDVYDVLADIEVERNIPTQSPKAQSGQLYEAEQGGRRGRDNPHHRHDDRPAERSEFPLWNADDETVKRVVRRQLGLPEEGCDEE